MSPKYLLQYLLPTIFQRIKKNLSRIKLIYKLRKSLQNNQNIILLTVNRVILSCNIKLEVHKRGFQNNTVAELYIQLCYVMYTYLLKVFSELLSPRPQCSNLATLPCQYPLPNYIILFS